MPLLPSPAVLPRQPREVMISLIRGARSFGSSARGRRSIRNCNFVFTSITDRVKAGLGSLRIADGVRVIVYVLGGRLSAPYGYTISESQDI